MRIESLIESLLRIEPARPVRATRHQVVRRKTPVSQLPIRVFISFDFDQMRREATLLGNQLRASPRFNVQNWSLREAAPERLWPEAARRRLNRSDVMVIVVNGRTWRAKGVSLEVQIARALRVPIRQIYPARCHRPRLLPAPSAPLRAWSHDNLERLLTVPRRRGTP